MHRRAAGLPATSLAWGLWDTSGMDAGAGESANFRAERRSLLALAPERGLDLFDLGRSTAEPLLLPAILDSAALGALARARTLPRIFRGVVRVPARRADDAAGSLAERLAPVPADERPAVVAELVREHVAAVLGHASADAVDGREAFKDLGFDSLTAVELRNRLGHATGLRLPATLVFDHPSPAAVADHLLARVAATPRRAPVDEGLDRLETALGAISSEEERDDVEGRLRSLLATLAAGRPQGGDHTVDRIRSATADEIFDLIDDGLKS